MGILHVYRLANGVIDVFIKDSSNFIAADGRRVAHLKGKRIDDDLFVTSESFAEIAAAVGVSPARLIEALNANRKLVYGRSAGGFTYIADISPADTTARPGRLTGYRIKGVYCGESVLVYSDSDSRPAPAVTHEFPADLLARVSTYAQSRTPIAVIARQMSLSVSDVSLALSAAGFAKPALRLSAVCSEVMDAMESLGISPSIWCSYYGIDPNDINRAMNTSSDSPRVREAAVFLSCDFGLAPSSLELSSRPAVTSELEAELRRALSAGSSIFALALQSRVAVKELYCTAVSLGLIKKESGQIADIIVPTQMDFILKSANISVWEWSAWYGYSPLDVARVAGGAYRAENASDMSILAALVTDFPGALKRLAGAYAKQQRRQMAAVNATEELAAARTAANSDDAKPPSVRKKLIAAYSPAVPLIDLATAAGCSYAYVINSLVVERKIALCGRLQKGNRYKLMSVWPELRTAMRSRGISVGQYASYYGLDPLGFDEAAAAVDRDSKGDGYVAALERDFPEIAASQPCQQSQQSPPQAELPKSYTASTGRVFNVGFAADKQSVTAFVVSHPILKFVATDAGDAFTGLGKRIEILAAIR